MSYIDVPVTTDADTIVAEVFDAVAAALPGWVAHEGQLDVALIESLGRFGIAERMIVDSLVPRAVFAEFGRSLLALPSQPAVAARAQSTWTAIDDAGYTVEAGTQVAYRLTGDTVVAFTVDTDVVIPAGNIATAAGEVTLVASVAGSAGNGLAAGPVELLDTVPWVASVVSTTTSSGGVAAETEDEYLDRLRALLRLLAPRPILPDDFSVLATEVTGVYRATTIDGYNPADATFDNERMVAVAVVDEDGLAVSSTIKTAVQDKLDAEREINFVVNVIDPTYTDVSVDFDVIATAEADPGTVHTAVIDAVTDYLSPAGWGGGLEEPPAWRRDTIIRVLDIAGVIHDVAGVGHINAITLSAPPAAPADTVTLTGVAPLPNPTVTGTVAAP